MKSEPFDPTTAGDADLRAVFELSVVLNAELDPETPHYPFDAWVTVMRLTSEFHRPRRWAVWDNAHERVIAYAFLSLRYTEDNRHLASFDIQVRPEFRRQGLGRALLRELAQAAADDGRTVLGSGTPQGNAAEQFLAAMSMEQKMLDRRSRCYIQPIPQELLDDWIATGERKGAAGGYELLLFEDRIPDEHRAKFISVTSIMNDAPRDDLDMEDWVLTDDLLADAERRMAESDNHGWTMVVDHPESDTFVSFTEVGWNPAVPQLLWQGGTAVRPEHRGHAIGRWIKAAMVQKVRSEMPDAEFIDTWNAGSNKWMLAINDDLGFTPYIWYTDWQGSVDDVKKAAAQ